MLKVSFEIQQNDFRWAMKKKWWERKWRRREKKIEKWQQQRQRQRQRRWDDRCQRDEDRWPYNERKIKQKQITKKKSEISSIKFSFASVCCVDLVFRQLDILFFRRYDCREVVISSAHAKSRFYSNEKGETRNETCNGEISKFIVHTKWHTSGRQTKWKVCRLMITWQITRFFPSDWWIVRDDNC